MVSSIKATSSKFCISRFFLILILTSNTTKRHYCSAFQPSSSFQRMQQRQQRQLLSLDKKSKSGKENPDIISFRSGANTELKMSEIFDERKSSKDESNNIIKGRGLLLTVALLYGTLNVSLRLVYQLENPPTASALSAARGWMASLCFLPLLMKNNSKGLASTITSEDIGSRLKETNGDNMYQLLKAGIELAIWNFLAQGLLNIGLLSTESARASFLTQMSVVFTPMISLLFRQAVPSTAWIGCLLALMGLTLLSLGTSVSSSFMVSITTGDYLVLGGALSWSIYLFRLSKIGSKFNEISLQAIKTTILAILYSIWFSCSTFLSSEPFITAILAPWTTHLVAWLALFYSALGPGMIADILQQQGQKHVTASEANIILSMEPVFAALFGLFLLGEQISLQETIGGGLIVAAALISTR